ncbi:TPA: hypothetical protein ACXP27_002303 [Klebsiella pneumoniae]
MNVEKAQAIENSMMCLTIFSRSIHTFFALANVLEHLDRGTGDLFPFRGVCNALIGDAAIHWCKVFGSDAEATHWKCVIDDHDGFRKFLFDELRTTPTEFHAYWKKMTEFRSNVIAHFNAEHFSNGSTPEFDTAIAAAATAHKYMYRTSPPNVNYIGPMDLVSYGKTASEAVMNRMLV